MGSVIKIFESLGINETIFVHFGIIIALYFLFRFVFLQKLQEIILLRESRTTKLEEGANAKYQEAEKLAARYNAEIQSAQKEGHKNFHNKRLAVENEGKKKMKDLERVLGEDFEQKREEIIQLVDGQKAKVMMNSKELADKLVSKLVN